MTLQIPKKGDRFWLCPAFFLLAAAPGFWVPVLANVLAVNDWKPYVMWAFLVPPLAGMISPLIFAARADQAIPAEKLLTTIVFGGSIFIWLAFHFLEQGEHPRLFILFLGLNALVTAPAWSLLTAITLSSTRDPERDFGKYRVWGTIGWMVAGWLVSLWAMDTSPEVGKLTFAARLLGGFCCFMLPHTPPKGGPPKNLYETLGLGALRVFRQRDTAVFFISAFLFSIPLAAFYMHTPWQLEHQGFHRVAAGMTVGQLTEIVAMLLMGWFLRSWRIKWIFVLAICCGMCRYVLFAIGADTDSVASILMGVALHGICWTYFFEAGRVFLQKRMDEDIRAQGQALFSLLTSGIGGLTGTLFVSWLQGKLVDSETGAGWSIYWLALAGLCILCLAFFLIGYRGDKART